MHAGERLEKGRYAVGIDVGSVSINCVAVDGREGVAYEAPYRRHFGQVVPEVRALLADLETRLGPGRIASVSFTGTHAQGLASVLGAPHEPETIAQVLGAVHLVPGVRTIVAVGGQDAALFLLDYHEGQWYLDGFQMNGPCASGTGSFIDQQAERLATALFGTNGQPDQDRLQRVLDEFIRQGLESSSPAPVACRCTVFTKSDMIHLQNKGEPLANIIAGLHYGNAANYLSTIVGTRRPASPLVFIGGVAANPLQVRAFRHYFPDLQVPPHHASLGALGAALQSLRLGRENRIDPARLAAEAGRAAGAFARAEPLRLELTHFDSDNSLPDWRVRPERPVEGYLGLDVGSTTTKYALVDREGRIFHKSYVPTRGKPIEVTREHLERIQDEFGGDLRLLGIATTGSGRQVAGDFLGADLVIDEITAHARGAVAADARIDTIFEIGGQDSKYIRLERGLPLDFDMNKVCAAGTGSFLHELANKMGINIVGEFEKVALGAARPVGLAERCTVFMESDLVSDLQKGAAREDLIAGLAYAIVHNYLNRVVGKRNIGRVVMFLGGPSLNRSIVAAFEKVLRRPLVAPKHREVMGAWGAALALRDAFACGDLEQKGHELGTLVSAGASFKERICRADPACHNECKLRVYDFGGRRSIWGGECGRYEAGARGGARATNLFLERQRLFAEAIGDAAAHLAARDGAPRRPEPGTVGVPLGLHALSFGVFWAHLLAGLGYRVLFSPATDNRISQLGVESMAAETCYPVKVFHGHVRFLLPRAESIFLPNVITMPTPETLEGGMLCPYVESSQYMVKAALGIPEERILRPTLHLKDGPDAVAAALARALPPARLPRAARLRALVREAWERQEAFSRGLAARGESLLREVPPGEAVWVVSGRPYNLYDERANLQLGRHLAALGITAVPMDFLEVDAEDLSDFPKMYWGLGSRILRAARRVARAPDLFGVHLTNFGCGADSFIEHFYRHLADEKPALILELDEHSAVAGLLTRLEAFRNVVANVMRRDGPGTAAGRDAPAPALREAGA